MSMSTPASSNTMITACPLFYYAILVRIHNLVPNVSVQSYLHPLLKNLLIFLLSAPSSVTLRTRRSPSSRQIVATLKCPLVTFVALPQTHLDRSSPLPAADSPFNCNTLLAYSPFTISCLRQSAYSRSLVQRL